MKKISPKKRLWLILSAVALVLFVAFTLVVKFVDVEQVGLAHLNNFVWQHLGANAIWESLTDWLGYLTILVIMFFMGLQVWQWVRRKSPRLIDKNLLALDLVLGSLVVIYLFFELVVVNYRPLLVDGALKASYPSSHAMLFCTLLPLTIWQVWHYLKSKPWCIVLTVLLTAVMLVGVVGRLLAGVHWFTDILAGIIMSLALCGGYLALTTKEKEQLCKQS